jgi:uncharacterized protein (TIGR03790 family)
MFRWLCLWTLVFCLPRAVNAGGSGLNTVVVANQNSSNSVALANLYCELRGVPSANYFRMTGWTGGAISWSRSEFEIFLREPLLRTLVDRGLTNQVDFLVLSMDIPYRVLEGGSENSTTSVLFYGFKTNSSVPPGYPATCSLPDGSTNSYSHSQMPFASAHPGTAPTNSFLAVMLTESNYTAALRVLERGFASDSSFPTQTVLLCKTSDPARNVRFWEFDNAIFDSRVLGRPSLARLDTDSTTVTNLFGMQTGLWGFSLQPGSFVPGAVGDTLTSFAGGIFENYGQTVLLAFLRAGASGSYGTVVEPCNYPQKFPDPLVYYYQGRGFSLAEAYYMSLQNPYQGLIVGEPLSAPFAAPALAEWSSLSNGAVLVGEIPLAVSVLGAQSRPPSGRIDLFVDGLWSRTLTNVPPEPGNAVTLGLNGIPLSYVVPSGVTLWDLAANLADFLNSQTNSTQVQARVSGDAVRLFSLNPEKPGSQVGLTAEASAGTAPLVSTFVEAASPVFLDTTATGVLGVLVSNTPTVGDWLQLECWKTNGTRVALAVTNLTAGVSASTFATALMNRINTEPDLAGADGVFAGDQDPYLPNTLAYFALYARSAGWPAARLQVALTASANLTVLPTGTNRLEDNLSDLQPRNHLYLGAGLSPLVLSDSLDTTKMPDGFHELRVVAYEGSSAQTQARVSRQVVVANTSLSASLTSEPSGGVASLSGPLRFSVGASGATIRKIELFTTGGSVGSVSNQSTAQFDAPVTELGLGLHPFYAMVSDDSGNAFRTRTAWVRVIPPFALLYASNPASISWEAVPGLLYEIEYTTNLSGPFMTVDSLLATNTFGHWQLPSIPASNAFYRVAVRRPGS